MGVEFMHRRPNMDRVTSESLLLTFEGGGQVHIQKDKIKLHGNLLNHDRTHDTCPTVTLPSIVNHFDHFRVIQKIKAEA